MAEARRTVVRVHVAVFKRNLTRHGAHNNKWIVAALDERD
jgi:hypothetical protein